MMTSNKDFDPGYGNQPEQRSHEQRNEDQEKTPGVYVRAENELPQELDMLWSSSRPYHKEERNPLISFLVGLIVGAVLTSAVFLLLIMRPQVQTGANEMTAPVAEEGSQSAGQSTQSSATSGGKSSPSAAGGTSLTTGATSYTVVSGDTLGRIAEKVYGSSAPQYVDKIQRANNMSSPDKLQLDQKLVIPPKDY